MAEEPGFEPGLPDPESGVLPLHYSSMPQKILYQKLSSQSSRNLLGQLSLPKPYFVIPLLLEFLRVAVPLFPEQSPLQRNIG